MTDTEFTSLAAYLRHLHERAARPSLRSIAPFTGRSHSHVADLLNGAARRTAWEPVQALVLHLGGNPEIARPLWDRLRIELGPRASHRRQPTSDPAIELLTEIRDLLRQLVDRE